MVPYIFFDFFFHFYENDVSILIGGAVNFSLFVQSRNVNSTKSLVYEHDLSFQFLVPYFTFSVLCVVFSVLVVSL